MTAWLGQIIFRLYIVFLYVLCVMNLCIIRDVRRWFYSSPRLVLIFLQHCHFPVRNRKLSHQPQICSMYIGYNFWFKFTASTCFPHVGTSKIRNVHTVYQLLNDLCVNALLETLKCFSNYQSTYKSSPYLQMIYIKICPIERHAICL